MSKNVILEAIKEYDAKFVDLRFTDIVGKEQHITIPACAVDDDFIENGKMMDGSSFRGWKSIHESDSALKPDLSTIKLDPFFQENTLFIRCDVVDPATMMGYERCPRSLALRAEAYLQSTGIADTAYFGPEPEFFIFDNVQWETSIGGAFYKIDSEEAQWFSGREIEGGNIGHRPGIKGGYFPVPPVDSAQDIRSEMALILEKLGLKVEVHHHEVATAGQQEIGVRFNTLVKKADDLQVFKYVVHNVAHNYGKTATFMPKPLVGDNGSGMHCHQSLAKEGVNLFSGDQYGGLSETALYYIGGIIKHARTLNAFTNPSTNSYKRLVPGFEAPVLLAYSVRNRSAAIRIPHVNNPKGRRIEVRFPDPTANPYLAFSAMMMAGLDGIQKKIHPGEAMDKDLYDLPPEELVDVPTLCASLDQAMDHLRADQEFLLQGDVFTKDFINNFIKLKEEEISKIRSMTHPYEFEMYYSL